MAGEQGGLSTDHPVTLHKRLKAATETLHRQVEKALDLDRMLDSLGDYARGLGVLSAVMQASIDALSSPGGHGPTVDLAHILRRRDWLLEDLRALGEPEPGAYGLRLELPGPGHALGCLYVLEGSALGGRVIARKAKAALGVGPARGGAYFNGVGGETGAHWSKFRASLDAVPSASPMADDAEAGAIATFAAFSRAAETLHWA